LQIHQQMADQMVQNAVAYCASKTFAGNTQRTLQALSQGRCEVCCHFSDKMIEQVCEYLGDVDRTVKAVSRYDPNDRSHNGTNDYQKTGINLVAWVDRKSAALSALGATLEKTLSASKRKIGCHKATKACYTLDVTMVDDKDILELRGLGLLINNKIVHSTPVWQRDKGVSTVRISEHRDDRPDTGHEMEFLDPDLAPDGLIIERAKQIEALPIAEQAPLEHHLAASKAVLIRRIISDQQAYIDIAKKWFTISDLEDIHLRRIGNGKIGGKSAGMLLAARILQDVADKDILETISVPESYFLGSDLIYIFFAMNGLMHWNNQKYKPEEQIREEYQRIQEEFSKGKFPPEVIQELQAVLERIGPNPLIVRSSSQLEDNFGTSFAGKYDSYFCPNQGDPEENLQALTYAISQTYASTLKPNALLYRRSKGLQDYDERMAILIQAAQGDTFGQYFFPFGAGVAFSRNIYRWSPQIRREDGFARLVWGLGTRAVERVGDDYPRPIALSHPTLHPDDSPEAIRRYSQQYIDLIDLKENRVKTLPIRDVLTPRYPHIRLLTQLEQDGYLATPRMRLKEADIPQAVITFQQLLQRTKFASTLSEMLRILEENYHGAVDIEFTIQIPDVRAVDPQVHISLLQCRPQSYLKSDITVSLPEDLKMEDTVFSSRFIVPRGYLPDIRHVIFVKPEAYFSLPSAAERNKIGSSISQLNAALDEKSFICVGPGRWGATNTDLGVFVGYSDIHNAGALVELAGEGIGPAPEPSLGTHFFQDLMEAHIYPLAIQLDDEKTIFNRDFFYQTPNKLLDRLDVDPAIADCLRLIEVASFKPDHHLELVMDDEMGQALAYLVPDAQ